LLILKLLKDFFEDPKELLNPFTTYSSDAYFSLTVDQEGSMVATFGSKLTKEYAKSLWHHFIVVLGLEREECYRRIKLYETDLRQAIGKPTLECVVDFNNLDQDLSSGLDKKKAAVILVDALMALVDTEHGLVQLSQVKKSDFQSRVDKILVTYDIDNGLILAHIEPRLDNGTQLNFLILRVGLLHTKKSEVVDAVVNILKE